MTTAGLILTGGASSRMGRDKAELLWGGVRAVDRLAKIAREAGCAEVFSVGVRSYGLPFVADLEPGGGPVAGVAAGLKRLARSGATRALVLAVDAPTLSAEDVAPLLAAPLPGAIFEGLPLPMVVSVAALPEQAGAGWPLRRLVEQAGLAVIPAKPGSLQRLRGANTPEERAALLLDLDQGGLDQSPTAD